MEKKLPDRYDYFALLTYYDGGISVTFPDLPGCVSHGDDEIGAVKNARDCLALHMCGIEEDGADIPKPSAIADIKTGDNQAVALIEALMPPMRENVRNAIVKKTLTIPRWLNDAALAEGINFSQTLQDALIAKISG